MSELLPSDCLDLQSKLSENFKSNDSNIEKLKQGLSALDNPMLAAAVGSELGLSAVEWGAKKYLISGAGKFAMKRAVGIAIKSVAAAAGAVLNVATILDLVDGLLLKGKWTRYLESSLVTDTFLDMEREFSKEPQEPPQEIKDCVKDWVNNTFIPTMKREQNTDLTSQSDNLTNEITKAFKSEIDLSAKIQTNIPEAIDPTINSYECMPFSYDDMDNMEMMLPSSNCPAELYSDIFKQYMTDNYPQIKLKPKKIRENFSFLNDVSKMNDMYVRFGVGSAASDVISRGIRETAERAAREGVERAAREGVERAAREGIERAAREGVERAARETLEAGAERAARETLEAGAERAARETLQKTMREGLQKSAPELIKNSVKNGLEKAGQLIKRFPRLAAAGFTAAGLAIYAASTGQSLDDAAGDLLKKGAGALKDIAGAGNDLACETTGICPKEIIEKIKKYAKIAGIGFAVVIVLMLLIWIISKFV
jgi:hypothetical protein